MHPWNSSTVLRRLSAIIMAADELAPYIIRDAAAIDEAAEEEEKLVLMGTCLR